MWVGVSLGGDTNQLRGYTSTQEALGEPSLIIIIIIIIVMEP